MKVVVEKRESDDLIFIGNMNLNIGGFARQRFVATLLPPEQNVLGARDIGGRHRDRLERSRERNVLGVRVVSRQHLQLKPGSVARAARA